MTRLLREMYLFKQDDVVLCTPFLRDECSDNFLPYHIAHFQGQLDKEYLKYADKWSKSCTCLRTTFGTDMVSNMVLAPFPWMQEEPSSFNGSSLKR